MTTSLTPMQRSFPSLVNQLRREFDSVLNRVYDEEETGLAWAGPSLNVAETENEFEVTVELPGVNPDDIDVEVRHGDLWISGERRHEEQTEGKRWHRVESRYGQFRRMIRLGEDVDSEKIDAQYKDGLLHIKVPKAENAKPRRIAVKH